MVGVWGAKNGHFVQSFLGIWWYSPFLSTWVIWYDKACTSVKSFGAFTFQSSDFAKEFQSMMYDKWILWMCCEGDNHQGRVEKHVSDLYTISSRASKQGSQQTKATFQCLSGLNRDSTSLECFDGLVGQCVEVGTSAPITKPPGNNDSYHSKAWNKLLDKDVTFQPHLQACPKVPTCRQGGRSLLWACPGARSFLASTQMVRISQFLMNINSINCQRALPKNGTLQQTARDQPWWESLPENAPKLRIHVPWRLGGAHHIKTPSSMSQRLAGFFYHIKKVRSRCGWISSKENGRSKENLGWSWNARFGTCKNRGSFKDSGELWESTDQGTAV